MKILQRISQLLSNHASLFIILISIVTFYVPNLFVWVKGDVQALTLGIIMLSMGMTLTVEDQPEAAAAKPGKLCSGW